MADLENRLSAAGEQWRSEHAAVAEPDFAAVTAVSAAGCATRPSPRADDAARRVRWCPATLAVDRTGAGGGGGRRRGGDRGVVARQHHRRAEHRTGDGGGSILDLRRAVGDVAVIVRDIAVSDLAVGRAHHRSRLSSMEKSGS